MLWISIKQCILLSLGKNTQTRHFVSHLFSVFQSFQTSTDLPSGDERLINEKCCPGLAKDLIKRIRKRQPNSSVTWSILKYNRTPSTFFRGSRVLSDLATPFPGVADTFIRQVVVRITTEQSSGMQRRLRARYDELVSETHRQLDNGEDAPELLDEVDRLAQQQEALTRILDKREIRRLLSIEKDIPVTNIMQLSGQRDPANQAPRFRQLFENLRNLQ